MSKIYFTADYHFGHPTIKDFCNRPFSTIERMNEVLIKFANQRAKAYYRTDKVVEEDGTVKEISTVIDRDTIIHVGDFANFGTVRGKEGLRKNPREYEYAFDAKVILFEGNHDGNNGVKNACRSMVMNIGRFSNVTVGHYPTTAREAYGTFFSKKGRKLGIHICGHVHKAWKYMYDKENNILNVNVGCDVWNYRPVALNELEGYINSVINELGLEYNSKKHGK